MEIARRGMTSHVYPIVLVMLLGLNTCIVMLDRGAFMLLAPLIQPDLRLSNVQIGMISAALAVAWALSGLGVGRLADRIGQRRQILVIGTIVFSLSSILSGFAAGFLSLLATRALMGLAEGGLMPVSQSLMIAEVAPAQRGLALGTCSSIGNNLVAFIGPPLMIGIATTLSWQHAFWIAGIPGLLSACLIWLLVREPKPPAQAEKTERMVLHLQNRNILINLLLAIVVVAAGAGGASFLPLYLVRVAKLSPHEMSQVLMAFGPAMLLYGIACPALSDRFGRKIMILVFAGISLAGGLVLANNGGDIRLILVGTVFGSAISGAVGLVLGIIPAESVAPEQAGTAIGLTLFVAELAGGGVAPVVVGRLADLYGLSIIPWLLAVCPVLLGLLVSALRETAPRVSAHGR